MSTEEVDPVIRPLANWGTIDAYDQEIYMAIVANAIRVHIDRERVRRGLWKEAEAKDQFNMIKIKVDRIMRTLEVLEDEEDPNLCGQLIDAMTSEALDIINYTVFGVRKLEGSA